MNAPQIFVDPVCPCCLRPLVDKPDPQAVIAHLNVGGIRRRILDILLANFGQAVATPEIADWIYEGRSDGGSLTAHSCIKTHAWSLRRLLAPYGLTVIGQRGHGGGSFMLAWSGAFQKVAA